MNKRLVEKSEIFDIIYKCYESDPILIDNYHLHSGQGLLSCVNRTTDDFLKNDVKIYSVDINNEFLGYFGDIEVSGNKCLTGFSIVSDKRSKQNKADFWNLISDHFNNDFYVGIIYKNPPGLKFLIKNGCQYICDIETEDGPAAFFHFVKEDI